MLTHGNFIFELGRRRRASSTSCSTRRRTPRRCCSCRWRTCSPGSSRSACVMARARLGHTADIKNLLADLGEFQPTFMLAVPRVFEKVFNSAEQKAERRAARARIFDRAAETAIAYSAALDAGRPRPGAAGPARAVRPARLRQAARRARRPRAGTPSPAARRSATRLGHFYRGIGLTVLEGYGLTETTAALDREPPDALKIGTVGRPLPGAAVRVADDGELLVQGRPGLRRLLEQRGRPPPRRSTRRLVPHRRRRRDRRGRLRPDHRPEEGDHRDRGRQERRAGRARGPAARAPPGQPVHGRRRRPALHRRAGHPRPGGAPGLAASSTASRPMSRAAAADDPDLLAEIQLAVDDANKAVSQGRGDPEVHDPRRRLDRGERPRSRRRSSSSAAS